MLPLFSLLVATAVSANPVNEPKLIGSIDTKAHAVSGDLYAIDEQTLMLKNFNYDGAGPDAFFWVGTEGSPSNVGDESKTAILAHPNHLSLGSPYYEYRDTTAPVLKVASQETITLILPPRMKVSDLKWFSVWCRQFSVDFGNLMIPADFEAPGAKAEPEPEPTKEEELPHPAIINNAVDEEPKAEPEAEAEAEPEPEHGHDHGHDHDHDHEDEGESPNSLGVKSEPEPESGASLVSISSLLSIMFALLVASLL